MSTCVVSYFNKTWERETNLLYKKIVFQRSHPRIGCEILETFLFSFFFISFSFSFLFSIILSHFISKIMIWIRRQYKKPKARVKNQRKCYKLPRFRNLPPATAISRRILFISSLKECMHEMHFIKWLSIQNQVIMRFTVNLHWVLQK